MGPVREFAGQHAVWGTCAGMIVMAREIGREQPLLGLMDIAVERNAFGRQIDSFESDLAVAGLDGGSFRAVFVRAPIIEQVGPGVEVLARLNDGTPVAALQERLLATAFHPELTPDTRLHQFFLNLASTPPSSR